MNKRGFAHLIALVSLGIILGIVVVAFVFLFEKKLTNKSPKNSSKSVQNSEPTPSPKVFGGICGKLAIAGTPASANVQAYRNTTLIASNISDQNGNFRMVVPTGDYTVKPELGKDLSFSVSVKEDQCANLDINIPS